MDYILNSESWDTAHEKYAEEYATGGFWPEMNQAHTEDLFDSEYKTLRLALDEFKKLKAENEKLKEENDKLKAERNQS